jgi:hypothetical protein
MATERLSMRKTREILKQKWELGRTHREVATSVGLSLGAAALTLGRAAAAGLDWAAAQAMSDGALEERLYRERMVRPGRCRTASTSTWRGRSPASRWSCSTSSTWRSTRTATGTRSSASVTASG